MMSWPRWIIVAVLAAGAVGAVGIRLHRTLTVLEAGITSSANSLAAAAIDIRELKEQAKPLLKSSNELSMAATALAKEPKVVAAFDSARAASDQVCRLIAVALELRDKASARIAVARKDQP